MSPESEGATFHFADSNLVAELAAVEPNVRAPVAMAWDADARLFVAEMTDYPSGPVSGRIRMLEDRDADGLYERATLFATNLAFPNGVIPWKNGVLVTAAPDIWFLADTNGDGMADVREKVLTGFAEGNQQLRVNGLYWGIDNWIYGANGRSDGDVRWADGSAAGSIRRRDFRFRPDTKQFEAIAGHSQFGMGHDDWGNRFPVFNNTPIRHVVMEDRYLERQPLLAGTDVVPSISSSNGGNRVYAITPPALLIPQPVGFFTSACGPDIYRGDALPREYQGNYFVCEPVQNLIQRRVLVPDGATFRADYAHTNVEFLSSSDPWFHGVFTATGPDGALYIIDMYREWVEHPHWVAPELRDKVDWRKGEEHGRIWRVRQRGATAATTPRLGSASNQQLVHALKQPNGWVRDTAHRLLFERHARDVAPELSNLVRNGSPQSRVHALHLLQAFTALSTDLLIAAMRDENPRVREQALGIAEHTVATEGLLASHDSSRIVAELNAKHSDPDARVRMRAILALGAVQDVADKVTSLPLVTSNRANSDNSVNPVKNLPPRGTNSLAALALFARVTSLDEWQITALLSSAGPRPWLLLKEIFGPGVMPLGDQGRLVQRFAGAIGVANIDQDSDAFLQWLSRWESSERLLSFAAFIESSRADAALKRLETNALVAFSSAALAVAASTNEAPSLRIASIRILNRTSRLGSRDVLERLLDVRELEAIQSAAARALLDRNDEAVATALFARWNSLPKAARQQLLASAARSQGSAAALLHAVESNAVPLIQVDAVTRQAIERMKDPGIAAAAAKLFAQAVDADRETVVQRYQLSLQKNPDRRHGAAVFEKNCAVCHQMQGTGARVGPDLSGIGTQTRESLLVQILDPSRQVLPDYVAYMAETKEGETYTGFVAAETAAAVTLRRPNEPDITLRRSELQDLRTSGKSLMPDGLEAAISEQDMADLIEFLRRPDRTLFSGITPADGK